MIGLSKTFKASNWVLKFEVKSLWLVLESAWELSVTKTWFKGFLCAVSKNSHQSSKLSMKVLHQKQCGINLIKET